MSDDLKLVDGKLLPLTAQEKALKSAEETEEIGRQRTALIETIKREANRRILKLAPEWKQRNLLAQATLLQDKGRSSWSAQDRADWQAGRDLWEQIAAIRDRSNALELNPPADPTNDEHWA